MSSQNSTLTSAEAESESNTPRDAAHNAAHQIVEGVAKVLTKPRFRGWIHVYSAVTAVFAGASLVAVSWAVDSTKAGLATMLYTFATIIMFTVSATYHRVNWKSETARKWMKRADHSMIFVFIAGSYTPFALGALRDGPGWTLFGVVWGLAAVGVLAKLLNRMSHLLLSTALYVAMGWLVVFAVRPLLHSVSPAGIVLLVAVGACYTLGAIVFLFDSRVRYAHFAWHLFVVAGSACHFFAALRYAR
jgi:hemolysin III